MDKLIIFGDSLSSISTFLIEATLREIKKVDAIEAVAICDAGRTEPDHFIFVALRRIAASFLKWVFNPAYQFSMRKHTMINLYTLARRFDIRVVVPEGRDINHPVFIKWLKDELKPSACLSFFCPQIFQKELIDVFDYSVNYHNSLLPEYGGIGATPWSLYNGASESGFTYHRINEKIDRGNILYQEAIPVGPETILPDFEYEKITRAADAISSVLEMMKNRDKGILQEERGSYFGWRDFKEMTTINHPSAIDFSELQRRLKYFRVLSIKIGDRTYRVTKLEQIKSPGRDINPGRCLCFTTKDDIMVKPTRFLYLPFPLYALYCFMRT